MRGYMVYMLYMVHSCIETCTHPKKYTQKKKEKYTHKQYKHKQTGVPVERMSEEDSSRLMRLGDVLKGRVIGQDDAVEAIARAMRRARSGLKDPDRPIATLMFSGPTGVGKTELTKVCFWVCVYRGGGMCRSWDDDGAYGAGCTTTPNVFTPQPHHPILPPPCITPYTHHALPPPNTKALAEHYFGSADSMVRLDMSEYMERHTVAKLIGAPPGYVGYGEGGKLTEAVRRRPFSVVLLDEIEKAHPDVFNILLQVIEDGRYVVGCGVVRW